MKMPRFDRTGPMGQGPMTGRGMGPCVRGMGRGFGWRYWKSFETAPVSLTKGEQIRMLESELKEIEKERQGIEKSLKELKG